VLEVLRGLPRVGARRAIRVTLAGSGTFSFLFEVMHNPTAAFFAAFGCVVLLVYVEFGGPKRQRFEQHIGLIVLTSIFVVLGTLCSQVLWLAVTSAVIVCFCVLMSGVVSSSLASATSGMLISFLLPVAFQGPLSTIPDRLLGWAIAGVVSLLAVVFILPTPSSDPLVDVTADTLATLSLYVRTVAVATGPEPPGGSTPSAYSDVVRASDQLRTAFFTAPFRPAGLSASARLLVKVIEWTLELDLLLTGEHLDSRLTGDEEVRALISLCADVLEEGAVALTSATSDTVTLTQALLDVQVARRQLEGSSLRSLHRHETSEDASTPDSHDVVLLRVLDQSFRVDNVANTIEKLGTEVLELVASQQRTWWQQSLGLEAKGADSRAGAARRRLASHLSRRSVWLHNSARGAIGLGLSVWVAYAFGVQHTFWVVFGTLAVLRSNALSTGQTVVRALTGTIEGIIIGSLIIGLLGTHQVVFWILLPFAICFTGFAPSAISFAAGQAGFTMTILILFNIVEPIGWTIGVIRIEDVALGCAVSLVVGLLLWPRGASAALRYSLADAVDESVHYLRSSVAYGLAKCDAAAQATADPAVARRSAQAAARRLDDAFREYLSERGSKSVSIADVGTLIAGVTAVRTTADSIQELWSAHDLKGSNDRQVVREALTQGTESVAEWFARLSSALVDSPMALVDPEDFSISVQELVNTVRRDLSDVEGNGTAVAFKIVWTDDYLRQLHHLQRRMQPVIAAITTASSPSLHFPRRVPAGSIHA
jgi:uncharacterized membrane protein YccC